MRLRVRHELRYAYDRPVFLEPTTVRLTPRSDATQRVIDHALTVSPTPSGSTRTIETDGTDALVAWFDGMHDALTVTAESTVVTLRSNPYDWIVTHDGAQRVPVSYPAALATALGPAIGDPSAVDATVHDWSASIADAADRSTTGFLTALTTEVHDRFEVIRRADGDPQAPEVTLRTRTGACRDTAILFIAACRCQGLAARFVSGYSVHHAPGITEHELHAWCEVHLPGGGWRGFDPSLGLAVADGHIAVAAAPDHHLAAPVSGTYRGTDVGSRMSYRVEIGAVGDGDPA